MELTNQIKTPQGLRVSQIHFFTSVHRTMRFLCARSLVRSHADVDRIGHDGQHTHLGHRPRSPLREVEGCEGAVVSSVRSQS